jgi:hypothetical protein
MRCWKVRCSQLGATVGARLGEDVAGGYGGYGGVDGERKGSLVPGGGGGEEDGVHRGGVEERSGSG